jgi:hypothetical protein
MLTCLWYKPKEECKWIVMRATVPDKDDIRTPRLSRDIRKVTLDAALRTVGFEPMSMVRALLLKTIELVFWKIEAKSSVEKPANRANR